jgi:hypothetical protein
MGHGADGPRAHRAHPDAARKKCCHRSRCVHGAVQLEDHDIGFDGRSIEHHTGQFAETFGEPLRVDMVLREPANVMAQGEYAGGSAEPLPASSLQKWNQHRRALPVSPVGVAEETD